MDLCIEMKFQYFSFLMFRIYSKLLSPISISLLFLAVITFILGSNLSIALIVIAIIGIGYSYYLTEIIYSNPEIQTDEPVIYFIRRADGIYKIGKTNFFQKRIDIHRQYYKQDFEIIRVWPTDNINYLEMIALYFTGPYFHIEGKHHELRKMNSFQVFLFICRMDFTTGTLI